jgi:large subunit ribosomal protein L30
MSFAQVPHLVVIETDRMRFLAQTKTYHEQLPREPWFLRHDPPTSAASPSSLREGFASSDPGQLSRPEPQQPRLTPFAQQQLKEHVEAQGLEGYSKLKGPPLAPRKYFQDRAREWRAKILTERGIFSADAMKEHARAIAPKAYRRRTGIRN